MFFKLLNFPFVAFFCFILMGGSVFSLCSTQWFTVWLGLEVNLMSFIPILVQKGNMEEVESGVKYFLTQAVASALLLLTSLMMFWYFGGWELTSSGSYITSFLILSSLLLKLGMSPFHFWVPGVVSGLTWFCNLLLLTWQKVVPMFIICFFLSISKELLFMLVFLSSAFGGIGGVNQTSIRALLAYSSILHMGWMMSSMVISAELCFIYFFIYSMILIFIFYEFMNQEMKISKQMNNVFLWNNLSRNYIIMMILSIGGMPPMVGFMMKWAVLMKLISTKLILLGVVLVSGSIISLYYYLVLSFSIILGYKANEKLFKLSNYNFFLSVGVVFNLMGAFLILWGWSFI